MEKTLLLPEGRGEWTTPFSQGWKVGNFVFVAGQVSADDHGAVIGEGDIERQTRNVFENITEVLQDARADWKDVVKLNTYYVFTGPEEEAVTYWRKIVSVRREYLQEPPPAATAVRVVGLAVPGVLIEADVIAVLAT